jgi:hypothetical protein
MLVNLPSFKSLTAEPLHPIMKGSRHLAEHYMHIRALAVMNNYTNSNLSIIPNTL